MSSKVYWSATKSRVQLVKQCGNLIGSLFIHTVLDERYYLHPLDDALSLMDATRVSKLGFIPDLNDCDDYQRKLIARLITSAFLDDAYREVEGKLTRRPPSLMGIADSYGHAFNIMANDDGKIRLIEPQTNEVFLPHEASEEYGLVAVEW